MPKIEIRPQTAEEAFLYIKNLLSKRRFYKENGYLIDIPEHSVFKEIFQNFDEISEEKENELRKIFFEEVYPKIVFSEALAEGQKVISEVSKKLEQFSLRPGFKLLDNYLVVLTPYGPGGSYDVRGVIVIKMNSRRSVLERIIHEAVHIGVEHEVLKKKLSHSEKEELVEMICSEF